MQTLFMQKLKHCNKHKKTGRIQVRYGNGYELIEMTMNKVKIIITALMKIASTWPTERFHILGSVSDLLMASSSLSLTMHLTTCDYIMTIWLPLLEPFLLKKTRSV